MKLKIIYVTLLLLVANSVFAKEVFLDCDMDVSESLGYVAVPSWSKPQIGEKREYELDIDLENKSAKWGGFTGDTFFENPPNINSKLNITKDRITYGDLINGTRYLRVDRTTLEASASYQIGDDLAYGYKIYLDGVCKLVDERVNEDAQF